MYKRGVIEAVITDGKLALTLPIATSDESSVTAFTGDDLVIDLPDPDHTIVKDRRRDFSETNDNCISGSGLSPRLFYCVGVSSDTDLWERQTALHTLAGSSDINAEGFVDSNEIELLIVVVYDCPS